MSLRSDATQAIARAVAEFQGWTAADESHKEDAEIALDALLDFLDAHPTEGLAGSAPFGYPALIKGTGSPLTTVSLVAALRGTTEGDV